MHKLLLTMLLGAPIALLPGMSNAKGCLKGAAVGGVAGHVAGHHGVAGAAAGCVIGHHRANVKDKEAQQQAAAAQANARGAEPTSASPPR